MGPPISYLSRHRPTMASRSWAAIARPVAVEAETPQPIADEKRGTFIVIPRARRFDTPRSLGQTKLGQASTRPSSASEPPSDTSASRAAPKFVSAAFPTEWYAKVVSSIPAGGKKAPEVPEDMRGSGEPEWHRLLNHARRNLFTEQFDSPAQAYKAGDEGLAALQSVELALKELGSHDRTYARLALLKHSVGQSCCYC